jgi:hypothetical protein
MISVTNLSFTSPVIVLPELKSLMALSSASKVFKKAFLGEKSVNFMLKQFPFFEIAL